MDEVALLDRQDTKYILSREHFLSLLPHLSEDYYALETANSKSTLYHTLYFDSKDLEFYDLHQRGKLNRIKIRFRKYVDSGITFLEIKLKNNKGRTVKHRKPVGDIHEQLTTEDLDYIREASGIDRSLLPSVLTTFYRITLVHKKRAERLTLDYELCFEREGEEKVELPGLVIAELKQEIFDRESTFARLCKQLQIRPERISKYCLGVALLLENVKKNRIKAKLRRIAKLTDDLAA